MSLTQERLKEVLDYNPETGSFHRKNYRGKTPTTRQKNLLIDGKMYQLTRLIFLYMLGKFPNESIIHLNGDREDHRWCNLKECKDKHFLTSLGLPTKSETGVKGLVVDKQPASTYYRVRFYYLGELYSKVFPYNTEGKQQALSWLLAKKEELLNV